MDFDYTERLSTADEGAVLTDPLSLAPDILERRRELWRTLIEREQLG